MVNNAETIGALIVNETLLRGERQLLSNRNPSSKQDIGGEAAPPAAPPISHNDKAMAPVLLTLLDEQLSGKIADETRRIGAREGEVSSSPNRIAARYVEDEQVFRADLPVAGTAVPLGVNHPQFAQTVPSPDLQFFLQRFLIGKTRNVQADERGFRGGEHGPKESADPSMVKVAGAVVGIATVLIVIAITYFR
ncbi:hypothetical protein [Hyphomicrobium sp.]|uniref:hypothetical protein n=1 Tax=Hyphomicrobium sp. TaxID=82 RepID=UPI000FA30ED5|nr:hypothetical protein [Hyphomicrobium sp.]RUP07450.1 MAG: hypothetical protein EKK38_17870 [Hyphomicrobium sp.]